MTVKKDSNGFNTNGVHYQDGEKLDPSENTPLNTEYGDDNDNGDKDTKDKKKAKDKGDEVIDKRIPYFSLYKYADVQDKVFLVFGSLFAIACGCLQPYAMIIFGEVTGVLVEYSKHLSHELTDAEKTKIADDLNRGIVDFVIKACVTGIVTIICTYVAGVLFQYSALRQIFRIRKLFFEKTLNQDISWYDVHKTGDFATTFTENLSKIEEGIGEKMAIFLFFMTIFVTGIIMGLILGWKLALVCLVSLPLSSIIMGLIQWLSAKFSQQELEAYGAAGAVAEEALSSLRTVIAFEGQDKESERYDKHLLHAKSNNIRKNTFSAASQGVLWFFVYACYALSFWFGVGLILDDNNLPKHERVYTPENMVSVFFCILMASWYFGCSAPYFEIFGTARAAAAKVYEVLDNEPVINLFKVKGTEPNEIKGEIKFENVHFHYPSRPDVKILQGFDLHIKSGETVALVGSSGCGKSTCIQLIQRFYDTISGSLFIDDNNISDLNLTWLRSKIGVVGQEPALFVATVAENIRYGNLQATQEDIERAAKKANAHNFIKSLPRGYQTMVGERGAQLSGGQKQRIAIARALVRKPRILLLDEATSALDTTSEAEVQAALDAVSGECTTIIVAHRLSTIRNAHRIIVVSEGRVQEEGTHSKLMEAKGAYFNLVESQGLCETDHVEGENDYSRRERIRSIGAKMSLTYDEDLPFDETTYEDNIQGGKTESSMIAVLKMNRPEWFFILLGCLAAIVTSASLPVYGLVFGDIIGVLAHPDPEYVRSESNLYCIYFVVLGIVIGIAMFLQIYAFSISGEKLTLRIRQQMFKAIMRQEMAWFDRKENGVGALCAKLASDAGSVQGAGGVRIGTVINTVSTLIISNVMAIYFHWKLALVLATFSPVILISIYFEHKFTQGNSQVNQKYLENSAKTAVEAIGNIRTVASLGCERVFYDTYVNNLTPYLVNVKKKSHFTSVILGVARSVILLGWAVGMGYGSYLMVHEDVKYGTVFIVMEIVVLSSWSIGNALSFSPDLQKGLVAASRIFKLINRVPEVKDMDESVSLDGVKGDVDYSHIYFSYPTRPSVSILNDLSLVIPQGKTVALVGSSGCGKSTIIQLLERFYDPLAGQISLDRVSTDTLALANLRSHIGIVSQEPNLFDRSIAENIAYGANDRQVGFNEIVTAAKNANIHNFITSLPQGYDTNLGTKGTQLSGGQKQRIAIARALIRNPRILLLDEATSALDNESEKVVQEALDNAKKDRTCITIAHRLTTIQDADVIIVLSEGAVAEIGKHSDLLEKKGLYYKFYKLQTGQK